MLNTIFEIIFLIFFIGGCTIRAVWTIRIRQVRKREDETKLERFLMFCNFIGMQVIPLIYVFTSWLDSADYHLPAWVGVVCAVIFGFALWLLWRSHADLGRSWTIDLKIREDHKLITDGAFKHIRHPMYAAHWLWGVAQALLLWNWIAGFSMLAAFAFLYSVRVSREEKMMLDNFGEEYKLYMERTGRVIPHLWR